MFRKSLWGLAAAALIFVTLGSGSAVVAAVQGCQTHMPDGYCCPVANGPGDECCQSTSGPDGYCCDDANGPNGYCCPTGNGPEAYQDPCCFNSRASKDGDNGDYYDCGSASVASVRGTAFEDKNANGRRDAGEPTMAGAWLKLSGGGSWFVCAFTGADATYGIPVVEVNMTYIIFPIAPVGWRTTTPVIKAKTVDTKNGLAFLYNDMGFVRDASAKTVDGCDQYNPSRPVPPGT